MRSLYKILSIISLFVVFSTVSHGFLGAFAPIERSVYCALSETIMRVECPSRSEPFERAGFNAAAFKILSESRDRLLIGLDLLLFAELPHQEWTLTLSLLFLISITGFFWYAIMLKRRDPPHVWFRMKLLRWSRIQTNSPAVIRA